VEDDGERWWDEVDKVMVVVGLCVRKRKVERGLGANMTKPSVIAQFRACRAKWWWKAMGEVVG
jgi:hypothetical protein